MGTPRYRLLLRALKDALGDEWLAPRAGVIYRTGAPYLVQTVSCQSSNFSADYVVATSVQVLCLPADEFVICFGERLRDSRGRAHWISGNVDPPVTDVLRQVREQSWVHPSDPLTLDSLVTRLDAVRSARTDVAASLKAAVLDWAGVSRDAPKELDTWSAGLVYGLLGREESARECLLEAVSTRERLRRACNRQGMSAEHLSRLENALREIRFVLTLVGGDQAALRTHCDRVAQRTAAALGLA